MYKTVALVALVALLTLAPLTSGQMDNVQRPNTSGCVIVQLVLERIENSIPARLYSSNEANAVQSVKEFLMRIAAVESDYGRADHTYRENYHGGIWQVDEADFDGLLDQLSSIIQLYRGGLRIDLDTALSWEDLRKPLYSGIAAMLKLFQAEEQIPDFRNVTGQADFWIRYYRNNSGSRLVTRENFTAVASSGCSVPCQSYPDIVFVVDSSGSVGRFHFQQALNFTANLVAEFRVGPDFTHIGVIYIYS